MSFRQDGSRTTSNLAHRDKQDEDRRLEYIDADEFLDQVAMRYDDVQTNHHQRDHYPVIKVSYKFHVVKTV